MQFLYESATVGITLWKDFPLGKTIPVVPFKMRHEGQLEEIMRVKVSSIRGTDKLYISLRTKDCILATYVSYIGQENNPPIMGAVIQ